jgi:hypothetical protein
VRTIDLRQTSARAAVIVLVLAMGIVLKAYPNVNYDPRA